MRIIAGELKGRGFASPGKQSTHPMGDKIRGALFTVLGDIEGLTLLDAFAGSGAVAFEAISRGAKHVVAIDNDKSAQRTIAENIVNLGIEDKVQLICNSASPWLTRHRYGEKFDLIVCDPPYNRLQENLVEKLPYVLAKNGVFIVSWPTGRELPRMTGMEIVVHKKYGDATLVFYKRMTADITTL